MTLHLSDPVSCLLAAGPGSNGAYIATSLKADEPLPTPWALLNWAMAAMQLAHMVGRSLPVPSMMLAFLFASDF